MKTIQHIQPEQWRIGTSFSLGSQFSLKDVKKANLDCIELVLSGNFADLSSNQFKQTFQPIIQEAKDEALDIWTIHLPFSDDWDLSTVDHEKRLKIIGYHIHWLKWVSDQEVDKVIVHPSFEPIDEQERADRITACCDSLNQIAEKAESLGITICVENLPRTCLGNSGEEILTLINSHKALRVCVDTNHALKEEPEDFIREVGSTIVTTHISDYDGIDEKHWLPKEGTIDWGQVIQALVEIGYKGPFLYEVGGIKDPNKLWSNWTELLEVYKNKQ